MICSRSENKMSDRKDTTRSVCFTIRIPRSWTEWSFFDSLNRNLGYQSWRHPQRGGQTAFPFCRTPASPRWTMQERNHLFPSLTASQEPNAPPATKKPNLEPHSTQELAVFTWPKTSFSFNQPTNQPISLQNPPAAKPGKSARSRHPSTTSVGVVAAALLRGFHPQNGYFWLPWLIPWRHALSLLG